MHSIWLFLQPAECDNASLALNIFVCICVCKKKRKKETGDMFSRKCDLQDSFVHF